MATEKLNEGVSVRIESLESDATVDSIKPKRKATKSIRMFFGILLIIILIFVTRIPYIGSYPDSYAFELPFGNAKYVVYLWLIFLCFFKICNFKFARVMYSKRLIMGTCLIMLSTFLILSIIQKYSHESLNDANLLQYYWKSFQTWANKSESQLYSSYFPHIFSNVPGLDAGIIGTVLEFCWGYVTTAALAIIALIFLVLGILFYVNKTDNKGVTFFRRWLIKRLGGTFNISLYDELAGDENDVKISSKSDNEIKSEASKSEQLTPPISFLPDTSVDNYFKNKSIAETNYEVISKFIRKLHIDVSHKKTIIMPQFMEIDFEVDGRNSIDVILSKQNELLKWLKVDSFNILIKGNVVKFEIPNKDTSKISIRQVLNSIKNVQSNNAVVGIDIDNTPLDLDIDKLSNMLIIGKRGSGGAMLLISILISLAYLNTPAMMEMIILSPLGDKSLKNFNNLSHMLYPVITEPEEGVSKLLEVLKYVEERENKFKELGAKTLEEHNRFQTASSTKMKTIVLAISSFDRLLKNSLQNIELLASILKRGPRVGIKTILLTINVNNESIEPKIYDETNGRFILRLESEHESLRLLDNYRGVQLFGNGDGYFFNNNTNKKIRFQTCYINTDELNEMINIIKTFYDAKSLQI